MKPIPDPAIQANQKLLKATERGVFFSQQAILFVRKSVECVTEIEKALHTIPEYVLTKDDARKVEKATRNVMECLLRSMQHFKEGVDAVTAATPSEKSDSPKE